jgi:hypothetical protein
MADNIVSRVFFFSMVFCVMGFIGLIGVFASELVLGNSSPVPQEQAAAASSKLSVRDDQGRAAYSFCVNNPPRWRRSAASSAEIASLCGCFAENALDSVGKAYKVNAMRYALDLVSHDTRDLTSYFAADDAEVEAGAVSKAASKCLDRLLKSQAARG